MPPSKGVPVKLGDGTKKRTLRFDNAALERLQEETVSKSWPDGMPLSVISRQFDLFAVKTVNTAIWIGLLHAEPELTREEVVAMVDSRKYDELAEAVGKALEAALPKQKAPETGEEGKADAS